MVRAMFQIIIFLIIVLGNPFIVCCLPHQSHTDFGALNDMPYFCYGVVEKLLLENDLEILVKNFDNTSFDIIKYLKTDGTTFKKDSPLDHPNIILELQYQHLNYNLSFPLSHDKFIQHYEYLHHSDLNNYLRNQY
jgi:hypothetical protein